MTSRDTYLFVSYARQDMKGVRPIIEALRQEYQLRGLPIHVWFDVEDLRPGQQWHREIERVLLDCIGLLVFVSNAAMQSSWVRREIEVAADNLDRLIIPVILEHVPNLPLPLATRQWLDLSLSRRTSSAIKRAASKIADATEG